MESGNPLPCGTNFVRGGELRSDPRGSSDESQPMDEMTDDREALDRRLVDRHHVELRLQLYVPKEELFPIPLQHTCVVRAARRTLDVLQQSRTDDCRNVDADRNLSESWTDVCGPGGDLQKNQATSRLDHLWPENLVQCVKSRSTNAKATKGSRETEARQCRES